MKKIFLILTAVFLATASSAQNFEGQITYVNTYKSKNPQVADEQWTAMLGDTQQYKIKGENYRSDTNGTMMQWVLFIKQDNKLYSKIATSPVVYYNDATVQGDEIYKSELNKDVLTVLGYSCDELVLTCKNGIQKFYFNAKFGIDPKLFENHKIGNWYDFVSRSKALPLKTVLETNMFTLESTATEIKPMQLDAQLFALPAGVKTQKSQY